MAARLFESTIFSHRYARRAQEGTEHRDAGPDVVVGPKTGFVVKMVQFISC